MTPKPAPYLMISDPQAKARLVIGGVLVINTALELPNWWWRFWYWFLLGWTWERL